MITRALLAILIVYVPNQVHFPTELGLKGLNVFNILLAAAFAAALMSGRTSPAPTPMRGRVALFCAMLFVGFAIGQLRGSDFVADVTALKNALAYMLLFFLFHRAVNDLKTVRWLIGLILLVALGASLEAIREALDYGFATYNFTRRASGPFGADWRNANRAGVFYATFTPLFVALLLFGPRWQWRLAGLGGTVAGTFAAFATYSRQAYLILAVGAFLLTLRRHLVTGLLLAAFVANYSLWAPTTVVDRLDMTYETDVIGEEQLEESAESRLIIWAAAWECIKEHPLGIGFNRFRSEIGNYSPIQGVDAHSQYVLIATENGIQGLLAFLLVVAGLIGIGLRLSLMAIDDEARVLGFGFTTAAVCFALGNVYGSPFFFGEVSGNFWALAALVARYTSLREADLQGVVEPMPAALPQAAS